MEFDFINDMLERVLIKKTLVDKQFLVAVSHYIDTRWFESSKALGIIGKLVVKYFNAYPFVCLYIET